MVNINLFEACFKLFSIILWCAHVTVIPDEIKIRELSRGISSGLNGLIPRGGHLNPNSILGDNELWKNLQKNEMKKNTSDTIKSIIPQRILIDTFRVWLPWNVLSRIISRHQNTIIVIIINILIINKLILYSWNHLISLEKTIRLKIALKIGHGL